jgi:hypothetical protein
MRAYTHTKLFLAAAGAAVAFGPLPAAAAEMFTATAVPSIRAVAPPPAGFDAVHASDAALAALALPPRPDAIANPAVYAKWVRAMSVRAKRSDATLQMTNIFHGPARQQGRDSRVANTATSSNWSGIVNTNTLTSYNARKSFYFLVSDYVIPAVSNATCDGAWDYSSQWAGIDGWNSGDVLQAGTEADAYCSGSTTSTFYSAWIEWYPYSESRISGFPVAAGDDMYVEVWNTSSTVGFAYMINLNTGQDVEFELTPPSGTTLVGNSAEWVVERPGVSGGLATLSDYALDYFSGAQAQNFARNVFLPGNKTSSFPVDMLDNNGNPASDVTLLGSSSMEFSYQ